MTADLKGRSGVLGSSTTLMWSIDGGDSPPQNPLITKSPNVRFGSAVFGLNGYGSQCAASILAGTSTTSAANEAGTTAPKAQAITARQQANLLFLTRLPMQGK
jgi:hypothetical protein